jgi:DNA-binding MarR family transcriptional regulator
MRPDDLIHPEHCLNAALREATRVAMQLYLVTMRETRLEGTQFTLLATIDGMGSCSMGDLAAWLRMDQTTLSRSLDLLRRARLVRITRDPADGRSRRVALSALGRARLQEAMPAWRAAQRHTVERFGTDRAAQLLRLLEEFAALGDADDAVAVR